MEDLRLDENDIGPKGFEALARILIHMPSLSVLLLAGNQPGYEGALALGPPLVGLRALQVCFLKQNYKYLSAATYLTTLSKIVRCLWLLTAYCQFPSQYSSDVHSHFRNVFNLLLDMQTLHFCAIPFAQR